LSSNQKGKSNRFIQAVELPKEIYLSLIGTILMAMQMNWKLVEGLAFKHNYAIGRMLV